jgi:hypothetical protein
MNDAITPPAGKGKPPQIEVTPAAADRIFVGFSTTAHVLSWFIRWVNKAEYSHAWLCHGDRLWGGAWITQADYPTVHSWTFEKATSGWSKVMVYEISPEFYHQVRRAMFESRRLFEQRFDISGLMFMAVVTLVKKWTRRRIGNWLAHPNQLFCSEFVEDVLRATGREPFRQWSPSISSPKQIYKACKKDSVCFRKVSREEFTRWLEEVGVETASLPKTLVVESLERGAENGPPWDR